MPEPLIPIATGDLVRIPFELVRLGACSDADADAEAGPTRVVILLPQPPDCPAVGIELDQAELDRLLGMLWSLRASCGWTGPISAQPFTERDSNGQRTVTPRPR